MSSAALIYTPGGLVSWVWLSTTSHRYNSESWLPSPTNARAARPILTNKNMENQPEGKKNKIINSAIQLIAKEA